MACRLNKTELFRHFIAVEQGWSILHMHALIVLKHLILSLQQGDAEATQRVTMTQCAFDAATGTEGELKHTGKRCGIQRQFQEGVMKATPRHSF